MQILGLSAKWFIDCDASDEHLEPAWPQVFSIGGTTGLNADQGRFWIWVILKGWRYSDRRHCPAEIATGQCAATRVAQLQLGEPHLGTSVQSGLPAVLAFSPQSGLSRLQSLQHGGLTWQCCKYWFFLWILRLIVWYCSKFVFGKRITNPSMN